MPDDKLRNLILNASRKASGENGAAEAPPSEPERKAAAKKPARKKATKKKAAKKSRQKAVAKPAPPKKQSAMVVGESAAGAGDVTLSRWREFATLYLFGRQPDIEPYNAGRAYRAVYTECTENTARVCATKLLQNPKFQKILREVGREKAEKLEVDSTFVAKRWLAMADANVTDYIDDDGNITLAHINALPKEITQNLRKLDINEYTTGTGKNKVRHRNIKIEIVDRKAVLDSIARWQGMFTPSEMGEWGAKLVELIRQGAARAQRNTVTLDGRTGKVVE